MGLHCFPNSTGRKKILPPLMVVSPPPSFLQSVTLGVFRSLDTRSKDFAALSLSPNSEPNKYSPGTPLSRTSLVDLDRAVNVGTIRCLFVVEKL